MMLVELYVSPNLLFLFLKNILCSYDLIIAWPGKQTRALTRLIDMFVLTRPPFSLIKNSDMLGCLILMMVSQEIISSLSFLVSPPPFPPVKCFWLNFNLRLFFPCLDLRKTVSFLIFYHADACAHLFAPTSHCSFFQFVMFCCERRVRTSLC